MEGQNENIHHKKNIQLLAQKKLHEQKEQKEIFENQNANKTDYEWQVEGQ